jgi:hypothetical protein
MGGKVVPLDKQHLGAADRRVARDRAAVDAAADDEKAVAVHRRTLSSC